MIPLDKLLNSENIILLLIAFFGAFFANVIRLFNDSRFPITTRLCRSWWDYGCYLFLYPAIGGFLVLVYMLEGTPLTSFLTLHIGVTAPLTLTALAGLHEATNNNREPEIVDYERIN
jgi:hypothetical protein